MRKTLRLQALEPRILLDAAGLPTALDTLQDSPSESPIGEETETSTPDLENNTDEKPADPETEPQDEATDSEEITPESDSDSEEETVDPEIDDELSSSDLPVANDLSDNTDTVNIKTNDIVVVDKSITNYQGLFDEIPADIEIVEINEDEDGLLRLSEILEGRSEINTLHIFSHGSQGSLELGNLILNDETLADNQDALQSIGNSLAADGDILLYGCNIADGETGIEFIDQLSLAMDADIAASDDVTGSPLLGGDWDLEYSNGVIEADSLVLDNYDGTLGFAASDHNGDAIADPLRMITWNVIGLDSNKPATEGPAMFMVGMRVNADAAGLTGYSVKIVDDDGTDIFGTGFTVGDSTVASDFDDGIDNIQFTGKTIYEDVNIDGVDGFSDGGTGFYRDFYFNVEVERILDSHDQIQPFHFEVFEDANSNGVFDNGETGQKLDTFSWLPDASAANTPLYLYVEKYISQARNDVTDQTYPTEAGADDGYAAIRISGYADTGNYASSPVTVFIGQKLDIRVEGQTATQGYPQLTLSTVFDTDFIQINKTLQYYDKPITDDTYQQDLGSGDVVDDNFDNLTNTGTEEANTSIYANPAGWNPATHSTMITSAPPKAGGGPIITDYNVTITGSGSGTMETLILDYSGSSFHYNADFDNGIEGIEYVRFNAVQGAIQGNVAEDTDGDSQGDSNLAGVQVTLTGDVNDDGTDDTLVTTTDGNGDYRFDGYWGQDTTNDGVYDDINTSTDSGTNPGGFTWVEGILPNTYTVTESAVAGYGDVTDYTNGIADGVNDNIVTVTLDKDATIINDGGVLYGVATADFVEGRPDLQLTKSVSNSAPGLGESITYTLTVTNTSAAVAGLVKVTEKLPTGLTYDSDNAGGDYDNATGVWTVGSVAANSSESLTITVTVNDDAPITNFAEITTLEDGNGNVMSDPDSTPGNNAGGDGIYGTADDGNRTPFEDDEAAVTIDASEADLNLLKTVSDSHPSVGDSITFKLILTNSGPDDATNIVVTDELPSGIDPATVALGAASIGSFVPATGVWTIAALANGATATLTFTATVDESAAFTNHAAITAVDQYDPDSDPNSDRNTDDGNDGVADDDEASVIITPQAADLSLSLVADNTAPDVGDTVTYKMILSNAGPDTATAVVVTQVLPAGVTYTGGGSSYDAGSRTVTWDAGDLNSGNTLIQTVTVTVDNNGTLTSTAEVKSTTNFATVSDPDSKPTDNGGTSGVDDWSDGVADDDEASVIIIPGAADLSLTKSFTVVDGTLDSLTDQVTFTLIVTNESSNPAYNVRVEDTMSSGLAFSSLTSADGGYTSATGIWDIGTINANSSATLVFIADVDSVLAQSNFAEIIEADAAIGDNDGDGVSTLTDTDSTFNNDNGDQTANEDDEALASLPAIPYADLEVDTSVSNASVTKDVVFDFYITVTNNGPNPVTGVEVQNVIDDSKYILNTWSSEDGTDAYDSVTGTWTIGAMAVGEQVTLTLTGYSTAATPAIINYAQVTASDLPDPDSTVNNGTAPNPVEDDESAISTGAASSRYDVALSQAVTRDGGKTAADNLVLNDLVTFVLTAENQGSTFAGNGYVISRWADGLDLSGAPVLSAGEIEYSVDGGVTYTTTFTNSPDYIRWLVYNDVADKFLTGTSETLTLVGSVNATGETDNIAENSAWWSQMGGKVDDDSSVPDINVFTLADGNVGEIDTSTDDLSDTQLDDDETSVSVGGSQTADLSISKQISVDGTQTFTDSAKLDDGQVVTFRIAVTNDSNSVATATNVVINEVLPTGLVYMRSYGDGSYVDTGDADSIPDTWNVGDLSKGATASLFIVTRMDWSLVAGSSITNQTEITGVDQTDPDSDPASSFGADDKGDAIADDDEASLVITEQLPEADLSLSKTISNSSPALNSDVTFTLTVTNDGPNDATNVTVADLLPAGLTYVSQSGDGTYNGSNLWTIGTVAASSSKTINIVATVTSTDLITNFAEIKASDLDDPDSTPDNGDQNPDEDDEASVSLTAQAADLSLSKSVSNANPNVGDSISFTLTVVNSGPNATTGVTVADALPAGFSQTGLAFTGSAAGDTFVGGVWTLGDVAVGEVHSLTITGTVDNAAAFRNFAQITGSSLPDPDSTVNNDSDQTVNEDDEGGVTVVPQAADLSLSKSVDNATPNIGDNVTFTLTLVNSGPNDGTNVALKDYLPAGMTYVSDTGGGSTSESSGTITWTVGTIAVGEIKTLDIVATVTSANALTNFAQVTAVDQADPDSTKNNDVGQTANEDDEASATVDARQIDLKLDKAVSRSNPDVGETVTFSLTITNESGDDATGVQITDWLPGPQDTNFTYVAASASDGGVFAGGSNTITWSNLDVAAGSIKVLTFTAVVKAGNPVSNVAEVTASDQPDIDSTPGDGVGDDYATVAIDGQQADLSLVKTVDNATPAFGDTVTFTLTTHNSGPDNATNVVVKDQLPGGLEYVSATGDGAYNEFTGEWTIAAIADGADAVLTLKAIVKSPAVLTNVAEIIASDQPDPDSSPDNDDGDQSEDDESAISVNAEVVDLSVTKTINNSTPGVGDVVTYTVTVSNRSGFDTASGISVADALPAGLNLTNATVSVGNYAGGVWNGFSLAGGTNATLTITGTVTNVTQLTNTAEITAVDQTDIDSTPGNGYATPETQGEDDWATVAPNMGTITGKVLDDRSGFTPGSFDAADSAVNGVTIGLYANDGGGNPVGPALQTTTTDSNGVYSFNTVAGSYVVVETDLAGYISVRDMEDINADGSIVGQTTSPENNHIPVTVVAGNEYIEKNFLDLTPWKISGVIYADNGTVSDAIDGADSGIDGVTVTLKKDTDGNVANGYEQTVTTKVTAGGGVYEFTGLGPGLYRVEQSNIAGYTDVTDSEGHTTDPAWNQIDVSLINGVADSTGNNFLDTAVPVLDLDVANAGTTNFSTGYSSGGAAVNITNNDAAVTDLDDTAMAAFSMTFAGIQDGAAEQLVVAGHTFILNGDDNVVGATVGGTNTFDITYVAATGIFTVTRNGGGDMLKTDINLLMQNATYQNTAGTVTVGNRTVVFLTNDGNDDSNNVTSTIAVANAAPSDVTYIINSTNTISEDLAETATFTITLGGDALTGTNTSSVVITPTGSGTSGTDYNNYLTAVNVVADAKAGVSYNAATRTLTFGATFNGTGTGDFSFTMDAVNDQNVEGTETIIGTLSSATSNNGSATINTAASTTNITEIDSAVTYSINSTASISEDLQETATFTISLGGDALTGSNTSSVVITPTGTGTSGTDYDNYLTAVSVAAAAKVGVSYNAGSRTLTFDATFNGTGTGDFSFTMDAVNDQNVEGTETIIGTLSGQAIDNGSATINTAASTTNITEIDSAVTYSINSTASISEDLQETATFTISLGGNALTGTNTSSVVITPTGTGTSGTDYDNYLTAVSVAAAAKVGVSYNAGSRTLTFDATFNGIGTGDFSFTMDAINDADVEGTETIVGTLSSTTTNNGSATINTATSTTNITETAIAVIYSINSTPDVSEDLAETTTFTISLGGDALAGANTSSVIITATGSATSGTDYDNFLDAVVTAANATAGVSYNAGTQTLTFDATFNGTGTGDFSFTMNAINDQDVEGTETIIGTLSGQTVVNGTAVINTPVSITSINEPASSRSLPQTPPNLPIPPPAVPEIPVPPVVGITPSVPAPSPATYDQLEPYIVPSLPTGFFHSDPITYTYNSNLSQNPVSLTGDVRDQYVPEGVFEMSIADGEFRHSDPSQKLFYEATLADGAPLPEYILFDSEKGSFKINADEAKAIGVDSVQVKVIAVDSKQNKVSDTFEIRFDKAENDSGDREFLTTDQSMNPISLTGTLNDQWITTSGMYNFSILNAFQHSDTGVVLKYAAVMKDGSPLPDFIQFDSETGMFYIDADVAVSTGIDIAEINVTAYDPAGNELSTFLKIVIEQNEESSLSENPQAEQTISAEEHNHHFFAVQENDTGNVQDTVQQPVAKASLMEQIHSSGEFGYQQDKTGMIQTLQSLFRDAA